MVLSFVLDVTSTLTLVVTFDSVLVFMVIVWFDNSVHSTHILGLIGWFKGATAEYCNAANPPVGTDDMTLVVEDDRSSVAILSSPDTLASETPRSSVCGSKSAAVGEDLWSVALGGIYGG